MHRKPITRDARTALLRTLDLLTTRAPTREARIACRDLAQRLRANPRLDLTANEADLVAVLAGDVLG